MDYPKLEASKKVVDETIKQYKAVLANCQTLSSANQRQQLARPSFKLIQELVKQLFLDTKLLRSTFRSSDFEPTTNKQIKTKFVQQLIEFVAHNGLPVVGCIASKVVAGLEPNKTNELLQNLAKIARQRQNSASARKTSQTTSDSPPTQRSNPTSANRRRNSSSTSTHHGRKHLQPGTTALKGQIERLAPGRRPQTSSRPDIRIIDDAPSAPQSASSRRPSASTTDSQPPGASSPRMSLVAGAPAPAPAPASTADGQSAEFQTLANQSPAKQLRANLEQLRSNLVDFAKSFELLRENIATSAHLMGQQ